MRDTVHLVSARGKIAERWSQLDVAGLRQQLDDG
jgi:predicted ester cyclase